MDTFAQRSRGKKPRREANDRWKRELSADCRYSSFIFRELLGGSGIICGEGEAAGGHCPRGGRVRAAEEVGEKLQRFVPVPCRKDSFVQRESRAADVLLLWLQQRRRRFYVRAGNRAMRFFGGFANHRGEMRDRDAAAEGAVAGRAQGKSAARGAGGNAPRSTVVFREAARGHARRKSGAGISRGSRAGQGDAGAVRHRLRAERRRPAAAAPEGEVQRKAADGVRIDFAGPERAVVRPLPAPHHV